MKKLNSHSTLLCVLFLLLAAQIEMRAQSAPPPYQKVLIQDLGTYINPCDYFKWWIRYTLPKPSANGGFIIQHVSLKYSVTDCDGNLLNVSDKFTKKGYYEAWPIKPGDSTTNISRPGGFSWDDVYSIEIKKNTKGKVSWQSTVLFVENPSATKPAIDTNNWHRDSSHASGGLLYTTTAPVFWDANTLSTFGKKHNAYFEWECCDSFGKVIRLDTTENAPVVDLPEDTIPQDTTHNGDGNDEDGGGGFLRPLDELRYEYLQQKAMQQGLKSQSTLSQTESAPRSKGFMRLYPVPAAQYAVLEFPAYAEKAWRVRIMNLNGQLVKEEEWKDVVGKLRLDLSSLAPGIYLLHVSNADGSLQEHFKLIRQE